MSVRAAIPVLTTERLRLRLLDRRDLPSYREILTSDRARYMDGPVTPKKADTHFMEDLASWLLDDFGYWTVADRETDAAYGFVGIAHPPKFPETELGWFATAHGEGHGFMAEAARAVLAWGFGSCGLSTLVSYIDPNNTRSIALAERLGATRDPEAARPSPNDLVFRHPNPESLS